MLLPSWPLGILNFFFPFFSAFHLFFGVSVLSSFRAFPDELRAKVTSSRMDMKK